LDANYKVSDYLLDRLAELGAERIFGVPGDYTLALLDHVVAHERLQWVGCTNELNAGYAADGYGRMRGIAALMTTFGVGELSAINAITGSFAEHVPVVHIVGAPSSSAQAAQRIVHHSLGDGVFSHFLDMHASMTCARAALTSGNAVVEIDRVLMRVRDEHLPGYLLLPTDVGETPARPPAGPLPLPVDVTDPDALEAFAQAAARLLDGVADVSEVSVLGGLLVHRTGATEAIKDLLAAGPLAHATTLWGKSLVDESDPHYLGIYAGAASDPAVRAAIEDASALIIAGVQFTDLNSGFFSQKIDRWRTIELGVAVASVGPATFAPVAMRAALRSLSQIIAGLESAGSAPPATTATPLRQGPEPSNEEPLSQSELWDAVAASLCPEDIVVADQGTSFYGMGRHRLPDRVTFLGQPLWASIGYTLPALLGACLAEPGRRGVLLIGDGAAQMTVQELSTLVRARVPAVVIVVDNDGYTVERAIHGAEEHYNDIARWDWSLLLAAFAPHDSTVSGHRVTTATQLISALKRSRTQLGVTLIQAVVPRMDVPELLSVIAREASRANQRRA
jgi:alpha-keto-acid decarboxylase